MQLQMKMQIVHKVFCNIDIFSKDALIGIPMELELLKQTQFSEDINCLRQNVYCQTAFPENVIPSSHALLQGCVVY